MARTKASEHRESTGNYYTASSGSELGSDDEQEQYQLDLTQAVKPSSRTSVAHSEPEEHTLDDSSLLPPPPGTGEDDPEQQGYTEHEGDDEGEEDEEDEEEDEEDSEDDEEDEEDDDEEGSQRARSRSVSSRASSTNALGSRRNSVTAMPPNDTDAMHVDALLKSEPESISISNQDTSVVVPVSPLPGASGSATPSRKKGFDGPVSPLSPVSNPMKPSPPAQATSTDDIPAPEASSSNPPAPKPKAKKKKPSSPEPPVPAPRQPLQTIRLEIRLGGPEHYDVDVTDEARKAGMLPPLPDLPTLTTVPDTDDSEEEGKQKSEQADAPARKPRRRRKKGAEYYDTTDSFIDDSLLDQYERKYIAQTKQTGFYVSSGEVALVKDDTRKKSNKPKSDDGSDAKIPPKRKTRPLPTTVSGLLAAPIPGHEKALDDDSGVGTKDSPIDLSGAANGQQQDEDIEYDTNTGIGHKRKRYMTVGGPGSEEGGKKRKIVDSTTFHPNLQPILATLREAIGKEDWGNKGKFPPDIKPILRDLAVQAIKVDEYDDHFFNLMPTIFPYNKFTMTKLIKRTIFDDHIRLLNERQDALLDELKKQADAGLAKAKEEHDRAVMLWEKRQGKTQTTGGDSEGANQDQLQGQHEDGDDPMDGTGGAGGEEGAPPTTQSAMLKRDQNPPQQKFRLNDDMRHIIWELVLLSNEAVRLENEKNSLENSVINVSDQAARKGLYQKIVAAFPDGWMSSGQISRDVSAIKKKLEKEQAENGTDKQQPQQS